MLKKEKKIIIKKLTKIPKNILASVESKPVWKNQATANRERLIGNSLFNKRPLHDRHDQEEIWSQYTLSIALAPKESEELALGYANRSALLLHLSKYEESILDIDRAIAITKSSEMKGKWLCRKAKCLIATDCVTNAEEVLQEAQLHVQSIKEDTSKLVELIQQTKKLLTNKNCKQNNTMTNKLNVVEINKDINEFSAISIVDDAKNGKHMIATRDIEPGEFIFVEKPFIISISNDATANPFCSHCYVACLTTIPCDSCCWCMFCSEKCKNEAWSQYHDTECLVHLYYLHATDDGYLNMRTVLFLLIKECRKAGGITQFKVLLQNADDKKGNPVANLMELSNANYSTALSWIEIFTRSAIIMLLSLAKYTNFFGKKYDECEFKNLVNNDDVLFVGALILKLLENISCAGTQFRCQQPKYPNNPESYRKLFVTNTLSSIKYSCDSNAAKVFTKDNNIAVFATNKIKAGCQITMNHYVNYRALVKEKRQEMIQYYLNYTCKCEACENNYPQVILDVYRSFEAYPSTFASRLFKQPLEMELFNKNEAVILSFLKKQTFQYTEEILKNVSESMTKASECLPKHSTVTSLLFNVLYFGYYVLYGTYHPIHYM